MKDTIPHNLLLAYFSGTADERQIAELSAWVEDSPDHAAYLSSMSWLDVSLTQQLQHETVDRLSDRERAFLDTIHPDAWESVLNSVLSIKDQRENAEQSAEPKPEGETGSPIRLSDICTVAGFVVMQGLRTRAGAIGSIAAVLVLGAVVYLTLFSPGKTANQQLASDQSPIKPEQVTANTVATLTATHHAQWAESASASPATGDKLKANQRLTLTAGFAEITTHRGAIAILEAPATFELIDSPNALRLHSGKLVGICETASSKGFIVRTEQMDITDLGTRFGVDASEKDAIEVHVFDGEVQVARPTKDADPPARRILKQGQAARAEASTAGFVDRPSDADRFAKDMNVRWLAGTGRAHAAGESDRNWRVVAVDGQPVTEHGEMIVVPEHHAGDSDPATSQWLLINESLNPPGKRSAVFTCQSTFELPDTIDPDQTKLILRVSADFSVKAVRVNGHAFSVPNNRIGDKWVTLAVTDHFVPGENAIEVDVEEFFKVTNNIGNSSSLRVEVQAHRAETP